ncbi:MAG: phosphonate ABC transporter, permease protein PhnE, partial [Pseudomonadota bacterium]
MTPDQINAAMKRVPLAFRDPPAVRLRKTALRVFMVGLFVYCLVAFNFSPERIWTGLGRLGTVVSFMFPPYIWTTWAEFSEILNGERFAEAIQ